MPLPKLEVPTYELIQPSTGKKIKFRPFLVKEHKILLTLSEASNDEVVRIVKDLVNVCTFKQLNVDKIPHFDIEFIFMNLRAKSIGEAVEVVITCANCEEKYDSSFNIENLEVVKPKNHSNKVKLTDNVVIEFTYPDFDSVVEVFAGDDLDTIFKLVKSCIVGVYDGETFYDAKSQSEEEIDEFVSSLTKEQFKLIEEFFTSSPKVVQTVETDCPNCNHHNVSKIEGLQNFFV